MGILDRVKKDMPDLEISLESSTGPKLMEHFEDMKPMFDNATSDEVLMFIKDALSYYFSK